MERTGGMSETGRSEIMYSTEKLVNTRNLYGTQLNGMIMLWVLLHLCSFGP